MKHLFFYSFCFVCMCILPGYAQLQLVPFVQPTAHPVASAARTQALDTLKLPFFDDFSLYGEAPVSPKTDNWRLGGGVMVSNNFSGGTITKKINKKDTVLYVSPPSKGVAVLDGLQASGKPYSNRNTLVQAPTDTLTSKAIDLAGKANVSMSFWWVARSLGEAPDKRDSLVLEFMGKDKKWRRAWSTTGALDTTFQQVVVTVDTVGKFRNYHSGFQFRFLAYGKPSGPYDVWLVDYIMIDENLVDKIKNIVDYTVTRNLKPLLKRYSSMPWEQFKDNRVKEWALLDSLSLFVYQAPKPKAEPQGIGYKYTIQQMNGSVIFEKKVEDANAEKDTLNTGPSPFLEGEYNKVFYKKLWFGNPNNVATSLNLNAITAPKLPVKIVSYFALQSVVGTTPEQIAINTTFPLRNDTISRTTILDDYYAYDDGTAEYGVGVRQNLGRVATRYILNKPDTLTNIDIAFSYVGDTIVAGQTFVLTVWKGKNGKPGPVLYEKVFPVQYGSIDKVTQRPSPFYRYPPEIGRDSLSLSRVVSDTIFIGWKQTTNDLIAVGYDLNTDSHLEQFSDISDRGQWKPNTDIHGSIMIRPVFKNGTPLLTSTEPNLAQAALAGLYLYPNPHTGMVYWNKPGIRTVEVCDLLGRVVSRHRVSPQAPTQLDLSALPNGMYLLRMHTSQTTVIRHMIKM